MRVRIEYDDGRYSMVPDPDGEAILPMGKIWDAYQAHVANDTVFQSLMSSLSQVADLHEQLDTLRSERDSAERERDRLLFELSERD